MQEITTFFEIFVMQDYVLFFVSFFIAIWFIFFWLEQVYKSYLWIILWLCVFSMINLTLSSMQDPSQASSIKTFFYNHRDFFSLYSILFIPFFAFTIPFNESITFRIGKKKWVKYMASFFFGFLFISFFLSIFLSIIHNRFFFSIDPYLIERISTSFIVNGIVSFFQPSIFFQFLMEKDYIISFVMTLYIFYKMTIWWIVDWMLLKIVVIIKNILENQTQAKAWWDHNHEDEEDDSDDEEDDHHHAHH